MDQISDSTPAQWNIVELKKSALDLHVPAEVGQLCTALLSNLLFPSPAQPQARITRQS